MIDRTDPSVTIATPTEGAVYPEGAAVAADYECDDAGSGIAACDGTVPSGDAVPTTTVATHTFRVTASEVAGLTATRTVTYQVVSADPVVLVKHLMDIVRSFELSKPRQQRLLAPLQVTEAALETDRATVAFGAMEAFGSLVDWYAELRRQATAVQAAIGC